MSVQIRKDRWPCHGVRSMRETFSSATKIRLYSAGSAGFRYASQSSVCETERTSGRTPPGQGPFTSSADCPNAPDGISPAILV